ncbi:hypothetical protein [Brochothrix thermosphacta]|uniref:hypothetical protein n=1 Tax=Brochothrix thermosphacta TaxID=2756 RepID=UPI0016051FA4|nr:hypothetical protein [Brochothrix thermosphacta]
MSSWDTTKVTAMNRMFSNVSLKKLTLGNKFRFRSNDKPELGAPIKINLDDELTGNWIREDGKSIGYTPEQFVTTYGNKDLTPGTYIAEVKKKESKLNVNLIFNKNSQEISVGEDLTATVKITHTVESLAKATNISLKSDLVAGSMVLNDEGIVVQVFNEDGTLKKEIPIKDKQPSDTIDIPDLEKGEYAQVMYIGKAWNNVSDKTENHLSKATVSYNNGLKETTSVVTNNFYIKNGPHGFLKVPNVITYGEVELNANLKESLVNRQEKDWELSINDLRGTNKDFDETVKRQNWRITAKAGLFNDSKGNEVLPSILTLVYLAEDGTETEINSDSFDIFSHDVAGETPINDSKHSLKWQEDKGIKAKIYNRGGLKSEDYQASINFEIVAAP